MASLFVEDYSREELEALARESGVPGTLNCVSGRSAGLNRYESVEFRPAKSVFSLPMKSREEEDGVVVVVGDGFFGLWAERNSLPDGNERWVALEYQGGQLIRN